MQKIAADKVNIMECDPESASVKSAESALTHLLTPSRPRGTFFLLSTTRECISVIELMQFTIVRSFGQVYATLCFRKSHQNVINPIPHGVFWITHTSGGGGGGRFPSAPYKSVI